MAEKPQDTDGADNGTTDGDGKTINDPLTRSDVEAPRAEFGEKPE